MAKPRAHLLLDRLSCVFVFEVVDTLVTSVVVPVAAESTNNEKKRFFIIAYYTRDWLT